jgi:hypothetical protein
MEKVIFWIIIIIAIFIIINKIIRVITGKSNSCSCCSYKPGCKKYSDSQESRQKQEVDSKK